jgi:hypothetical protein
MPYGLQGLKGLYSGHITLVGNGPSLDVEQIEGPSIAMNSISVLFPETEWRPDFYVCTSRELMQNPIVHKRIVDVLATGVPCFLASGYYRYLSEWKNSYYMSLGQPMHEPREKDWLQNGTWFVCWTTTMVATAQIAQYLGFTSYSLVGCDGYIAHAIDEDPNHFSEKYNEGIQPPDRMTDEDSIKELNRRQKLAFEHIARHFKYVP